MLPDCDVDFEKLDFRIFVDMSRSMSSDNKLEEAIDLAGNLVEKFMKYDRDGVEIGVFGNGAKWLGRAMTKSMTEAKLKDIELGYVCDFHSAVKMAFARRNTRKNTIAVFITDALMCDGAAVLEVITEISNSPDLKRCAPDSTHSCDFNLLFVQIGDDDDSLWLEIFDDDITTLGGTLDIVDVQSIEEVKTWEIEKVVAKAIAD